MGAAKQADREIPPQIKQQMNRFRRPGARITDVLRSSSPMHPAFGFTVLTGISPMPTFDEEVQQIESARAGKTQLTDPVLVNFHTPKMLARPTWKEVAQFYWGVATAYAEKNNRHIDELAAKEREHRAWKIDQLERSTKEYERFQEIIKQRDGMIQTLKDAIHVLTKRGI